MIVLQLRVALHKYQQLEETWLNATTSLNDVIQGLKRKRTGFENGDRELKVAEDKIDQENAQDQDQYMLDVSNLKAAAKNRCEKRLEGLHKTYAADVLKMDQTLDSI